MSIPVLLRGWQCCTSDGLKVTGLWWLQHIATLQGLFPVHSTWVDSKWTHLVKVFQYLEAKFQTGKGSKESNSLKRSLTGMLNISINMFYTLKSRLPYKSQSQFLFSKTRTNGEDPSISHLTPLTPCRTWYQMDQRSVLEIWIWSVVTEALLLQFECDIMLTIIQKFKKPSKKWSTNSSQYVSHRLIDVPWPDRLPGKPIKFADWWELMRPGLRIRPLPICFREVALGIWGFFGTTWQKSNMDKKESRSRIPGSNCADLMSKSVSSTLLLDLFFTSNEEINQKLCLALRCWCSLTPFS